MAQALAEDDDEAGQEKSFFAKFLQTCAALGGEKSVNISGQSRRASRTHSILEEYIRENQKNGSIYMYLHSMALLDGPSQPLRGCRIRAHVQFSPIVGKVRDCVFRLEVRC